MIQETGKIIEWNDEKAYGFIGHLSGKQNIFFHLNDYSTKHKRPKQGLTVIYNLSSDKFDRRCAVNVCPKFAQKEITVANKQLKYSLLLSGTFIIVVSVLIFIHKLPVHFLGFYLLMSLILYLIYAKDKSAAQKDKWRTPESTLHFLSLIGGWPGAIIAQNKLRHKSKKVSFRISFWLTVILNCSVLFWLLSAKGEFFLNMFFDF